MARKFDKTKKRDKLSIRVRSTDRTVLQTWTLTGSTHLYYRRLSSLAQRDRATKFRNRLPDTLAHREKYFWEWFCENRKEDIKVLTERQQEIFLMRYEKN